MSVGGYLVGVVWLGLIGAALAFGAVRVRRRILPAYDGAVARLAEIVLGLGAFVLVPELLGAIGWFRPVPVLLALVGVGIGAGLLVTRSRAGAEPGPRSGMDTPGGGGAVAEASASPRARRRSIAHRLDWTRAATVGAVALAALVLGQWTSHVVATYTASSAGVWDGDSLWYHLPFATHFVQTGWVTRPLFTNADTLVTYFPANSEVVLGLVLMPFSRDIAVPLVNLGWVALTFAAGWVLGRRYGAPAVGLAGAAVALSAPVMAATQGGTARNDVMGVALFMAAVALVAHADWRRNGLAVAGVAAGLALGVKLSTLIPVAILAVGLLAFAPRGRRWRVAASFWSTMIVVGSFWYVRNLVVVGNPVPTVAIRLGPVHLPSVFAESVANTSLLDRVTARGGIDAILRPGFDMALARLWWVVLIVLVALPIVLWARGPDRFARCIGAVVVVGSLAYVVMPNGSPAGGNDLAIAVNFGLNVRYLMPVLTLALASCAALPRMRDGRWALGSVIAFAVVMAFTVTDPTLPRVWEWATTSSQRIVGMVLGLLVVGGVALVARIVRGSTPTRIGVVAAAAVIVAVVAGFVLQRSYLDRRYTAAREGLALSTLFPWPNDLPKTRVGIVGTVVQYPLAGERLQTTVRYVGVRRDDGGFRRARTCRELRTQVREARDRYVVTSIEFFGSNTREIARVNDWMRTIDGVRVLHEEDGVALYELTRRPDPDACP